jgi:RNA polymerase sigma-70 factor (ECF subfamily)
VVRENEDSDAALIAAWRRGEEAAASVLVRRHSDALARFLAASGAGEDLEDLVQETFYRAFRRLDGFRGTAAFRTWLMAIGSNALKDTRRRRRAVVLPIDERDVVDATADPHDGTVERDLLTRLQVQVAKLPPKQRDVFLMRAQQGAEYDEIASVLNTSVGAARVHYHQAVKRLKAVLE